MTLAKCEEIAFKWPDNLIVAKEGNQVVDVANFVFYSSSCIGNDCVLVRLHHRNIQG